MPLNTETDYVTQLIQRAHNVYRRCDEEPWRDCTWIVSRDARAAFQRHHTVTLNGELPITVRPDGTVRLLGIPVVSAANVGPHVLLLSVQA